MTPASPAFTAVSNCGLVSIFQRDRSAITAPARRGVGVISLSAVCGCFRCRRIVLRPEPVVGVGTIARASRRHSQAFIERARPHRAFGLPLGGQLCQSARDCLGILAGQDADTDIATDLFRVDIILAFDAGSLRPLGIARAAPQAAVADEDMLAYLHA